MEQQGINFSTIPQTAIKVITSPAAFYRGMQKKGGFGDPLVFMLVMGAVTGILQAVFSLAGLRFAQGAAAGMAAMVYVPVAVLIGGFIGAAILFVIWKLMGSQEDYETAYRCGAYASAFSPVIAILGLVPYAGMAAGTVIWVYLLVVASVEVHRIMPARAWLVFGIIGLFFIVMGITSEMRARKLAGQMQDSAKQMQDAARKMQGQQPPAQQPQVQPPSPQGAANRQLDDTIQRMEEQMKNMPPAQQAQMRAAIEQMKKARAGQ